MADAELHPGMVIVGRRVLPDGHHELAVVRGGSRPTRIRLPLNVRTLPQELAVVNAWAASPPRRARRRR